jgi:hypothetical protein
MTDLYRNVKLNDKKRPRFNHLLITVILYIVHLVNLQCAVSVTCMQSELEINTVLTVNTHIYTYP